MNDFSSFTFRNRRVFESITCDSVHDHFTLRTANRKREDSPFGVISDILFLEEIEFVCLSETEFF